MRSDIADLIELSTEEKVKFLSGVLLLDNFHNSFIFLHKVIWLCRLFDQGTWPLISMTYLWKVPHPIATPSTLTAPFCQSERSRHAYVKTFLQSLLGHHASTG